MLFVDDFSRFTWMYLKMSMSQVEPIREPKLGLGSSKIKLGFFCPSQAEQKFYQKIRSSNRAFDSGLTESSRLKILFLFFL